MTAVPSAAKFGLPWQGAGCCGGFPGSGAASVAHSGGSDGDEAALLASWLLSEPACAAIEAITATAPIAIRAPPIHCFQVPLDPLISRLLSLSFRGAPPAVGLAATDVPRPITRAGHTTPGADRPGWATPAARMGHPGGPDGPPDGPPGRWPVRPEE